jgi:hypothetical protein
VPSFEDVKNTVAEVTEAQMKLVYDYWKAKRTKWNMPLEYQFLVIFIDLSENLIPIETSTA